MVMENTITINVCLKYKAINVYIIERFPLCFKVLILTKKPKMRLKYFFSVCCSVDTVKVDQHNNNNNNLLP